MRQFAHSLAIRNSALNFRPIHQRQRVPAFEQRDELGLLRKLFSRFLNGVDPNSRIVAKHLDVVRRFSTHDLKGHEG
jgi:hypothetical protein